MNLARTGRPFSLRRTDLQRGAKCLFQRGVANLPGVTLRLVADALDEGVSTVEAWANPERPHNVPLWILSHPELPEALRTYLSTGLDATRGIPAPKVPLEAQSHVMLGSMGELLLGVADARVGQGTLDAAKARGLLPHAIHAHTRLGRFITQLQIRAGVLTLGGDL